MLRLIYMKACPSYRTGQIGLLLLVVMGVIVALAVSVASSSLSDVKLSRQETESSKTFNAAESAVEEALRKLGLSTPDTSNVSPYSLGNVTTQADIQSVTNNAEIYVKESDVVEANVTGATSFNVYWTLPNEAPGSCTAGSGGAPAGLEIVGVDVAGVAKSVRSYYNPYNCSPETNGFAVSATGSSRGYRSAVTSISLTSGTYTGVDYVRFRPIYNNSTVRIEVSGGAQVLLYRIASQAQGGDARTDIEAKRSPDYASSPFDFAIFTTGQVLHNN